MALHAISLFAGVGMLDEGASAAFELHGQTLETVCYVEREAGAAGQLVNLMEAQCLPETPIWSDVTTFDASACRGKVDCVIAGFPCQDLSIAGRRAGLDGARSGLFFEVLRIANDSGARIIILENVKGITSATATAIHEDFGQIEERAVARVVGELADCGWDAEWCHVRASGVGASHHRERWFCVAWRGMENTEGIGGERLGTDQPRGAHAESTSGTMADSGCLLKGPRHEQGDGRDAAEPSNEGHCRSGDSLCDVANSIGSGDERFRKPGVVAQAGAGAQNEALEWEPFDDCFDAVVNNPSERTHGCRASIEQGRESESTDSGQRMGDSGLQHSDLLERPIRSEFEGAIPAMANTCITGSQGREQRGPCACEWGAQAHGSASQLRRAFFAPGPADSSWPGILRDSPGLAPAIKPGVRLHIDGVAVVLDAERAPQLRSIGNGVVALQAAAGIAELLTRSGIFNKGISP